MSTAPSAKIVTQLGEEDLQKLLTGLEHVHLEEDDNKVVTSADLASEPEEKPIATLWSDPERLKLLATKMQAVSKVRFVREKYPEPVLMEAMVEVFNTVDWYDYNTFASTIRRILTGPPRSVPFAVKTRNKRTGKMDFWLIRAFINVKASPVYSVDGTDHSKRDVLMSKQFCEYLRDYCRTQLKDEVQFWAFTGTYKGKQQLDMSLLHQSDIEALESPNFGETDPDNLVMFQFKKKIPEIYVGRKPTPSLEDESEFPPPPRKAGTGTRSKTTAAAAPVVLAKREITGRVTRVKAKPIPPPAPVEDEPEAEEDPDEEPEADEDEDE